MADPSTEAVVLLSGGLDSMVVAAIARERGLAINALTIDYNQRHRREIDAARDIAQHLGGLCDSCRLRRAGFKEAGLEDRTSYAAPLPEG